MEIKVYKSRPHFQEVWSWQKDAASFCGMTRISRPGRAAAHFYSASHTWPFIWPGEGCGVVELSSGPNINASPALAGME